MSPRHEDALELFAQAWATGERAAVYLDRPMDDEDDVAIANALELRALRLTILAQIVAGEALHEEKAAATFAEGYYDVEIMGHRQRYGYVRELRVAGRHMLEVAAIRGQTDDGDLEIVTELYSGGAVFAMSPITEEQAVKLGTEIPF